MTELSGRALDLAVARVLGYRDDRDGEIVRWYTPAGLRLPACDLPHYSTPAGLGPVLAWLERARPATLRLALDYDPTYAKSGDDDWRAAYETFDAIPVEAGYGATLPVALCRLLVAWAKSRGAAP